MRQPMLKDSERLTLYLKKQYVGDVHDFRWKNRISSLSEAVAELIKIGLKHQDEYDPEKK